MNRRDQNQLIINLAVWGGLALLSVIALFARR